MMGEREQVSPKAGPAPWLVLLSVVVALAAAFFGSGVVVGTPIDRAADGWLGADATPLAPGAGAFRIWSVIYLGLLAYAIWRLTAAGRSALRATRLDVWVVGSAVLNAVWIWTVQLDLLVLSVPVILVLLAVLVRIHRASLVLRPDSRLEALLLDGTMGLYLGWVCVASVANIASALAAAGFNGVGLSVEVLAGVALALTALIGIGLSLYNDGRFAPALALSWGLAWIGVGRLDGAFASSALVVMAMAAAGLVLAAVCFIRVIGGRSQRGGHPHTTEA